VGVACVATPQDAAQASPPLQSRHGRDARDGPREGATRRAEHGTERKAMGALGYLSSRPIPCWPLRLAPTCKRSALNRPDAMRGRCYRAHQALPSPSFPQRLLGAWQSDSGSARLFSFSSFLSYVAMSETEANRPQSADARRSILLVDGRVRRASACTRPPTPFQFLHTLCRTDWSRADRPRSRAGACVRLTLGVDPPFISTWLRIRRWRRTRWHVADASEHQRRSRRSTRCYVC
jgi:hypothetical protein